MSPRKTNMLEAFRASIEPPPPPAPTRAEKARARAEKTQARAEKTQARAEKTQARSENTQAGFEPARAPKARGSKPAPQLRSDAGMRVPAGSLFSERAPVFLVATLIGLGLLGGAYWLGRITAGGGSDGAPSMAASGDAGSWDFPDGEVFAAGGESQEPGEAEAASSRPEGSSDASRAAASPAPALQVAPGDELDDQGRTADDRSFYDKTNRFTVRAIYYRNTTNGWKRALGAYRYLRAQGLPAIAPIDQGDIIVLCVGAEPSMEGRLAELSERVRALSGPPPQNEAAAFADAFFVNIDDLVDRG